MKIKIGMGLAAAAAMFAFAGSAQAVPYEGLAFNNLDTVTIPELQCSGWSCSWVDVEHETYSFTQLAQDFSHFGGGDAHRLADPVDLSDVGQARYDYDGSTLAFDEGDVMSLGSHTAKIVGGTLDVGGPTTEFPPVTLPLGFGTITPDFSLTGELEIEIDGVVMTFHVCEAFFFECFDDEDSRPLTALQPYNTLNVGNEDNENNAGDGSTDLAMFLFLMSDDCTEEVGCSLAEPGYWYSTSHKSNSWCRQHQNEHKCDYKPADSTIWMKIALWGEESGDVPEPATLSLFGLGLLGLGAATRRRRKAA